MPFLRRLPDGINVRADETGKRRHEPGPHPTNPGGAGQASGSSARRQESEVDMRREFHIGNATESWNN